MKLGIKSILFIIVLILRFVASAQNPPVNIISARISQIRSCGDTLLYLGQSGFFLGPRVDTCVLVSPQYLFWRTNNQVFVQKFADCYDTTFSGSRPIISKVVSIVDSEVFDYLNNHFEGIISSELFPSVIKESINGREVYIPRKSSHPTITYIAIYVGQVEHNKNYSDDCLIDGNIRNIDGTIRLVRENVNLNYNMSTPLYKLSTLLDKLVEELERGKIFKYESP